MKLSQTVLAQFDAEAARQRARLETIAPSIDRLAELLAGAGNEYRVSHELDSKGRLHVIPRGSSNADDVDFFDWMQAHGFAIDSADTSRPYVHYHLRHPELACLITVLLKREASAVAA